MWESDNTMDKPVKIVLNEDVHLSLNAVTSEVYEEGTVLTSASTQQRKLFLHLIEKGKADEYSGEKKTEKTKSKKKSSSDYTVEELRDMKPDMTDDDWNAFVEGDKRKSVSKL